MKIFLCLCVLILFGIIGYSFKIKSKQKLNFYNYLKDYIDFFISNISLFKNNIVSIIDNYLITHKNKNAKYSEIFVKNGQYYQIDSKTVSRYVNLDEDTNIITSYLNGAGSNEFEFEKNKAEEFKAFLDSKVTSAETELKTKADLFFKLFLMIGAVICIIIW